jgi:hypothetical protein
MNTIRENFNWKIYLDINVRDENINTEDKAVYHWIKTDNDKSKIYSINSITQDFDWKSYRDLNPDIVGCDGKIDYEYHWYKYGLKDNRKYKEINLLNQTEIVEENSSIKNTTSNINEFDWKFYINFYPDLRRGGVTDEKSAVHHYFNYGIKEGRIGCEDVDEYSPASDEADLSRLNDNNNNTEFNWKFYLDFYPDLRKAGLIDEKSAEHHYFNYGIKEGRIGSEDMKNEFIPSKDKLIIVLSNDSEEKSSQFVQTLLINIQTICYDYKNYDIVTNENIFKSSNITKSSNIIKYLHEKKIIDILTNQKLLKFKEVILNITSLNFSNFSLKTIYDILLLFRSSNMIDTKKIILNIHDFNWLYPSDPKITISDFTHRKSESIEYVNKIFNKSISDLVIFPSKHILDLYEKKGLILDNNVNYVINNHPDIYYIDIMPYFHKVNNVIKIAYIRDLYNIEDYDIILNLIKVLTYDFMIEFHLIGDTNQKEIKTKSNIKIIYHGKYKSSEIFKIINLIKPHLFVLSSICYETWNYDCNIVLKTGLPIFYEKNLYGDRLNHRQNTNIFPYSHENFNDMYASFIKCLKSIRSSGNSESQKNCASINYVDLDESPSIYVTGIYHNLYSRVSDISNINNYKSQLLITYQNFNYKYSIIHNEIKPFAVYFPQFHRVEENNINFYENYNDLISLSKIRQNGYKYELTPLNNLIDYYDLLLDSNIIDTQISIAKSYGIYGFSIYHYWFANNKTFPTRNKVMYKVVEKIFSRKYENFYFYLTWPNENWTQHTTLTKKNSELLQDYDDKSDILKHFNYLLKFFKHQNYYQINNKPVFMIHHPWLMNESQLNKFYLIFDQLCKQNGFNGIYLCIHGMINSHLSMNCLRYFSHPNYKVLMPKKNFNKEYYDYSKYLDDLYDKEQTKGILSTFTGFDNTARLYGFNKHNSTIANNDTLEYFEKFLLHQMKRFKNTENETKIFLINAWNEWGENMVLEPSNEEKFSKLEIFQKCLLNIFS